MPTEGEVSPNRRQGKSCLGKALADADPDWARPGKEGTVDGTALPAEVLRDFLVRDPAAPNRDGGYRDIHGDEPDLGGVGQETAGSVEQPWHVGDAPTEGAGLPIDWLAVR
jgi:hypothetical protein